MSDERVRELMHSIQLELDHHWAQKIRVKQEPKIGMDLEFYKSRPIECDWLSWIGQPDLYSHGLFVTREDF